MSDVTIDNCASIDDENALLAQLIFQGDKVYAEIADLVSAEDFSSSERQLVYEGCRRMLENKEICEDGSLDVLTINQFLKENGYDNFHHVLTNIAENDLKKASISKQLAKTVHKYALKRQMIANFNDAQKYLVDNINLDPKELQDGLNDILDKRADIKQVDVVDAAKVAMDFFYNIKDGNVKTKIIPTGIAAVDAVIEGLRPGTLDIIGARTGVGKSAFATNILCNILQADTEGKNYPVILFSLEMQNAQVMQRMISSFGKVNITDLLDGRVESYQWHDIIAKSQNTFGKTVNGAPKLLLCDKTSLNINDVNRIVHQINILYGGVSGILLDYIQLMPIRNKAESRAVGVGEISRQLKEMAMQYQMFVLGLAQLNRNIEQRKEKTPLNSDIKDSGAIEQDADLIMLLTRNNTEAMCHVTKNRNGACGSVPLHFNGNAVMFY